MAESLRILVLEDNQADAELILFDLQEAGLSPTAKIVMTEKDYVRELQKFSPDLILSDYDLPKYNGALALAEAKRRCPDTPFILVTGAVTEDRAIEILTQGARDYVLKSRLRQRLVSAVMRALAEAKEQKARKKAEDELREAHRTLEERVKIRTAELEAEMAARMKTEEALRESEERWQFALEGAGDGLWDWNAVTNHVYFSKQWKAMLGYTEEDVGDTLAEWDRRVHPDDKAAVYADLERHFRHETEIYQNEHRLLRKDGRYQWVLDRGKVIKWTEDGKPSRVIGTHTDITERKRAEEALRESEERFRTIFEQAAVGVSQVESRTGRFIRINQKYCDILGYSPEEMLGKSFWEITHPDDLSADEVNMARLIAGDIHTSTLEKRYIHKNGTIVWVNLTISAMWVAGQEPSFHIGVAEDITARKQAEEMLREQLHFLQQLLDAIPIPIFYKDRQGIFRGCNVAYEKFVGLTKEQVIGKIVHELFPQDLADIYYQADEALFTKQGAQVYETSFLHADGNRHDIIFNKATYVGTDGSVAGLVGAVLDITERKRAEEKQRRSREIAERLANEMAVIAEIGRIISSTLDIDEVYERFAAEAKKLIAFDRIVVNLNDPQKGIICTTYSSGLDVPGRRPGDIYPLSGSVNEMLMERRTGMINRPSSIEEITDQYPGLGPAFQAGMRSIIAVPLISRDVVIGGLHFHSKIPKAHVEQDLRLAERIGAQIAGAIDNAQLFSDFNRAATSLRESESRFRAIFEQAAVGVAEIEIETGRFLRVNRQLCEIVGRTEEELLAATFRAITHPDDLQLHKEKTALLLAGKIGYYNLEMRYLRKDGGIVWANLASSPLWKPGEAPTRNLVVVQDITERRQAEAEMRSLQERLQRAEKMEALGTLAGGVAHDLNNVLGIVVGYAELLLSEVDQSSPIRPHLLNIMTGGERAAAIVQDLLTLARRGVSNRQVLNLNKIVMDYQNLPEFETFSSYHPAVQIRTDLEPDILNISGSSVHLSKTLFNLASNAAEAMPNGGVLTIKTANRYLDKPIKGYDEVREGDYVVLSVSDTGEGIPAADLKRIFEPFYTKKVMGRSGTGLGLAVVWGTVKDHHGYINVQSEEGKGSTFTLYFPVTREEIPAESAAVSLSEYTGKGESILIVDDVQGQRDLAAEMLRSLNYNVTSAASGEEAVAYLEKHTVDLMVLDMIMDPGMDGLETYQSVLEVHPKQQAIIVSGFSESERVNAAQTLGAGAYVRKPYVIENIGLAVRKELDRK